MRARLHTLAARIRDKAVDVIDAQGRVTEVDLVVLHLAAALDRLAGVGARR